MSGTFRLSMKARQRLFVNGAVLRFDRRVGVELLNDAVFLIESHVLQPSEITTPLKQVYFIAQAMLMDPTCASNARPALFKNLEDLRVGFKDARMIAGLDAVGQNIGEGRILEALKRLRGLFALEAELLGLAPPAVEQRLSDDMVAA